MTVVIARHLSVAGLEVNFKKGKTGACIQLYGSNAKETKRELYRHTQLGIDIPELKAFLRVVPAYTHLGTQFTPTGNMRPEIRRRFGMAHQRLQQMTKAVFKRRGLKIDKKANLCNATIGSNLWYNTAIWPPLTTQEEKLFEGRLHRLYRRILIRHHGDQAIRWGPEKVRAELRLPDMETGFHIERLRYARQLATVGEEATWALIENEGRWIESLKQSIQWISRQGLKTIPHCSDGVNWESWHHHIRQPGEGWTRAIRNARQHAILQQVKDTEWREWHNEVNSILEEHLGVPPNSPTACLHEGQHFCAKCKMSFQSKSAWSVHAFKRHSRVTHARQVAEAAQCPICGSEYHQHTRLQRYLRHA